MQIIKESCTENLAQTLAAEINGADRIEFCGDLSVGGITPDKNLILENLEKSGLPIKVMIRPRGGDFVYSKEELNLMESDILWCKENGVGEVVFGILTADNKIDVEQTTRLAKLSSPMKVTFHKAIDEVEDIIEAVEILKGISQVTSVLTSGGAVTAVEGRTQLKKMVLLSGDDLIVIVAGKVVPDNLGYLIKEVGAREYHGRKIV